MLRRWALNPKFHSIAQASLYVLAGFCLSAASLGGYCLPLTMALVCAGAGWFPLLTAAGGFLGYWVFWGVHGYIGMFWILGGLLMALLLGEKRFSRQMPLLLPSAGALIVAASGVVFQLVLYDMTPIPVYILRVALGSGGAMLFARMLQGRNPILDWLGAGLLVLALAQIMPIPYLGLGYLAAGFAASAGAFPMAALAGLALDLAQVTKVPMTAVLAMGYLVRFLPRYPKWVGAMAPTAVYVGMMALLSTWDLYPLPGLLIGSILGIFLPVPD